VRKTDSALVAAPAVTNEPGGTPKQLKSLRPNVILLLRHVNRKERGDTCKATLTSAQMPSQIIGSGVGLCEASGALAHACLVNELDTFTDITASAGQAVPSDEESLGKALKKHNARVRTGEVVNARCCFWDTQPFFTPPVHIPTRVGDDSIQTFGWFCSPECAAAFIATQYSSNDNAHEHLTLLHHVYGPIYNTKSAFHRAPDPRHVLDCFGGAMTIEQYRNTLKSGKQIQSLAAPLVKSVSEIHLVTPRSDIVKPLRGKRQLVAKRIHT
jgi:hypothetical protein